MRFVSGIICDKRGMCLLFYVFSGAKLEDDYFFLEDIWLQSFSKFLLH